MTIEDDNIVRKQAEIYLAPHIKGVTVAGEDLGVLSPLVTSGICLHRTGGVKYLENLLRTLEQDCERARYSSSVAGYADKVTLRIAELREQIQSAKLAEQRLERGGWKFDSDKGMISEVLVGRGHQRRSLATFCVQILYRERIREFQSGKRTKIQNPQKLRATILKLLHPYFPEMNDQQIRVSIDTLLRKNSGK